MVIISTTYVITYGFMLDVCFEVVLSFLTNYLQTHYVSSLPNGLRMAKLNKLLNLFKLI